MCERQLMIEDPEQIAIHQAIRIMRCTIRVLDNRVKYEDGKCYRHHGWPQNGAVRPCAELRTYQAGPEGDGHTPLYARVVGHVGYAGGPGGRDVEQIGCRDRKAEIAGEAGADDLARQIGDALVAVRGEFGDDFHLFTCLRLADQQGRLGAAIAHGPVERGGGCSGQHQGVQPKIRASMAGSNAVASPAMAV